jgi:hypothetical protein
MLKKTISAHSLKFTDVLSRDLIVAHWMDQRARR